MDTIRRRSRNWKVRTLEDEEKETREEVAKEIKEKGGENTLEKEEEDG